MDFEEINKFTFLENLTKNVNHSGGSFYDHLYNTGQILYQLGEPEYICDAGLYHSIYDTAYFKANLGVDRNTIKNIIGSKAENLVYIFCNLENRTEALLNRQDIPKDIHIDLLKIEYANAIEQNHQGANLSKSINLIQKHLFTLLYSTNMIDENDKDEG